MFVKFQQRLGLQPALPRSDVLCVRLIQAISFQTIAHSSARRPTPIPFSLNYLHTLLIATEGVPSLPSHFPQFCCNLSPFGINTCRPLRMCCKQKTYATAKSFRCNTYKKPGGGGPIFQFLFWLVPSAVEGNSSPSHSRSFFSCAYGNVILQTLCSHGLPWNGGVEGANGGVPEQLL